MKLYNLITGLSSRLDLLPVAPGINFETLSLG